MAPIDRFKRIKEVDTFNNKKNNKDNNKDNVSNTKELG